MPHYRFFVDMPLQERQVLIIGGNEYHHMIHVMRLKQGEELEIVNGCGYLATAILTDIGKEEADCLVKDLVYMEKPPRPFIIAQALLKPTSLDWVIEKNTELGASALWLFPAFHSEKTQVSKNQLERLQKQTLSALKQCGRLYLPEIHLFPSLAEVLSQEGLELFYGDLSPASIPFQKMVRNEHKTTLFAIGPEQGFHKEEVSLLESHGAKGISLHQNILRAETASIVASALLSSF